MIGNAVPPLLAEVVARRLRTALQNQKAPATKRKWEGALLSFVPALSNGVSPALQHVTDSIESKFRPDFGQGRLF